jgi:hypothetical protein
MKKLHVYKDSDPNSMFHGSWRVEGHGPLQSWVAPTWMQAVGVALKKCPSAAARILAD